MKSQNIKYIEPGQDINPVDEECLLEYKQYWVHPMGRSILLFIIHYTHSDRTSWANIYHHFPRKTKKSAENRSFCNKHISSYVSFKHSFDWHSVYKTSWYIILSMNINPYHAEFLKWNNPLPFMEPSIIIFKDIKMKT